MRCKPNCYIGIAGDVGQVGRDSIVLGKAARRIPGNIIVSNEVIPERKYASGAALRTALEERLKRASREEGIDLQRLRRQVAFDRFLARLVSASNRDWILKGGYAMELRFVTAAQVAV